MGLYYSALTSYLGFRPNEGEYKVMGLAPYGKPIYADLIKKHLIDYNEDHKEYEMDDDPKIENNPKINSRRQLIGLSPILEQNRNIQISKDRRKSKTIHSEIILE